MWSEWFYQECSFAIVIQNTVYFGTALMEAVNLEEIDTTQVNILCKFTVLEIFLSVTYDYILLVL